MNFNLSLFALLALAILSGTMNCDETQFTGKEWAVLVAGSNGWDNYRHQADVCHAYHVLRSHGIPEEQIIVMMYDDIAHNSKNPTPGVIINHPKGEDVYKGVPKDYTGKEVNPDNFVSVLLGNRSLAASGKKVLQSGPNDHVFVYFTDHGGPGVIGFPNDVMPSSHLVDTLKMMNDQKMFKQLVFYLEACESGSMFENTLPSNINVFAVTASDSDESSWACYWDEKRAAYLGDEFSVEWIEESEKRRSLNSETIDQQYRYLVQTTNSSHVMEYGDMSIAKLPLGQFQGLNVSQINLSEMTPRVAPHADAVPSYDVPLIVAKRRAQAAVDPTKRSFLYAQYEAMIDAREFMNASMQQMAKKLQSHSYIIPGSDLFGEKKPLTRTRCYESLLKTFDENCFSISTHPHSLRFLYILVNACENMLSSLAAEKFTNELAQIISSHCIDYDLKNSVFRSIV